MPDAQVVLAGEADPAAALQAALQTRGIRATTYPIHDMAADLTGFEQRLAAERSDAGVSVGTGEGALVFAITAAKLGIPLAVCLDGSILAPDDTAGAPRRILSTLAALEVEAAPEPAAECIAGWLAHAASLPDAT